MPHSPKARNAATWYVRASARVTIDSHDTRRSSPRDCRRKPAMTLRLLGNASAAKRMTKGIIDSGTSSAGARRPAMAASAIAPRSTPRPDTIV
jgi:hypothetical protein